MGSRWDSVHPVTVRQLSALDVLAGAVLVGGQAGLDRRVQEVVVATGLDVGDPPPASLVVLDGSGLRNDTYQVDLALRSLSERDGSALLLIAPASALGLATGRLANKLRLPLLTLPAGNPLTLCDALRQQVLAPQLFVTRVVLESMEALRQGTDADGVPGALKAVTKLLDTPASLVGMEGGVVAGEELDPPLTEHDRLPVPMSGRLDGITQVVQPISLAPRERPSFWLVVRRADATDIWTSTAADVLRLAALSVGTRLVADRLQSERDARFRLGVLSAITASLEHPEPALLEQIGVLGWQVSGWCTAVHIQMGGDIDQLRVLTLTDDFARALARVGITASLIERPDGWTYWTVAATEPPTSSYRDLVRALLQASRRFVDTHSRVQLFIGVGRPYQGLHGLQTSLGEAREASTIAQAGGGDAVVQHIDELGVKRILLGWYASETFAEFARTLLGPLMKVDVNHELLPTLEAFLDCESSPTEAGALLNVHRNTVLNRIERARAALSVDLDDPEERLAVQLACRIRRLRGLS
jgi:PucR-like helix-turn-helix protein/diguanylate cyclase with GGDEF domain